MNKFYFKFRKQSGRILTEYSLLLLLIIFVSVSFFFLYGQQVKIKFFEIVQVLKEEKIINNNKSNNKE